MPYNIQIGPAGNTTTITVNDNTVNSAATNLNLLGQGFRNYGDELNTNFVRLLENFAGVDGAAIQLKPTRGQLWFDVVANQLKVYDNTNNWVPVTGSTPVTPGNEADTFADTVTGLSEPVTGFLNGIFKVGAFSTGPVAGSVLDASLNANFPRGLNSGLNLNSSSNSGVWGASAVHFGIGNGAPMMSVTTSATNIYSSAARVYGNLSVINSTANPNPLLNMRSNGIAGTTNLRFTNGVSGRARILFNNTIEDKGTISYTNEDNTLELAAETIKLSAVNPVNSVRIVNQTDLNVNLESGSVNSNYINWYRENNLSFTTGINTTGNFVVKSNNVSNNSLFINSTTGFTGINNNNPQNFLDVGGGITTNSLIVSAAGSSYELPQGSGIAGQIIKSNGDGQPLSFINNDFIEGFTQETGIFLDLTPNHITFKTSNVDQMIIDDLGDVRMFGTATVSSLNIVSTSGEYSLPVSAGQPGEFLVSQGDGSPASWGSPVIPTPTLIESNDGNVGFYTEEINDTAIIKTNNEERLVINQNGSMLINTSISNYFIGVSSNNGLLMKIRFDSTAYKLEESNGGIITTVSASSNSRVRHAFNISNTGSLDRLSFSFFEFTDTSANKSIDFYLGDGTNTIDSRIGIGDTTSFFNLESGNFGVGIQLPTEKFQVLGTAKFSEIKVSGEGELSGYTLPTSAGSDGQLLSINGNKAEWINAYKSNEEGYDTIVSESFGLVDVTLSAFSWVSIFLEPVINPAPVPNAIERTIIRFNDITVSANNQVNDLLVRIYSANGHEFIGNYNQITNGIAVSSSNEWQIENFLSTDVNSADLPNNFTATVFAKGSALPVGIDFEYHIRDSSMSNKENSFGYIEASAVTAAPESIYIGTNNKVKFLTGWISKTIVYENTSAPSIPAFTSPP